MDLIIALLVVASIGYFVYKWWKKQQEENSKYLPGMSPNDNRKYEKLRRNNPQEAARIDAEAEAFMADADQTLEDQKVKH